MSVFHDSLHRYKTMLDCWKTNPELRPSFLYLKHKTEEFVQHANQNYSNKEFNLIDFLPQCNFQITSDVIDTESITDDNNQYKESGRSKVDEVIDEGNSKGTTS